MSIVEMNRISIIGLEKNKEHMLDNLMKMGKLELIQPIFRVESDGSGLLEKYNNHEEVTKLEDEILRVKTAVDYLSKYENKKKPLFETKKSINHARFNEVMGKHEHINSVLEQISSYDFKLSALKSEENRLINLMATLEPWKTLDVPLELTATVKATILMGVIPSIIDAKILLSEISEQIPESFADIISTDRDQSYIYVITHSIAEEDIVKLLKNSGFTRVSFKDLTGRPIDIINSSKDRIIEIEKERIEIEKKIEEISVEKEKLEILHDHLTIRKDRKKAFSSLLKTDKTFVLEGWLPERDAESIKKLLQSKYECIVDIIIPCEEEEFPIYLENNVFASSVESVTQMYSLPHSREIDPNSIMAPFFVLFFGLMLSDGGYGITMAALAGIILWKLKPEGTTQRFMKLMFFCGISTILWGALFGSWFGIEALGEHPLWFNPSKDPEEMLKWSLFFGVIHIFIGLGVRGANLIRKKKYLDVVFDVLTWYVFFTGFVLFVLPYVPKIDPKSVTGLVQTGKYLLLGGGILLFLTQGRGHKNILMKIVGGLSSLYDLIAFMSDVLSYSRLLALGLATSVIASIVNQMSAMGGLNSVVKVVLFIIILLVGHAFNFAINALGAYVHSSRLQYIEFFGKFYKGGGRPFEPLKINTKYFNLKNWEV